MSHLSNSDASSIWKCVHINSDYTAPDILFGLPQGDYRSAHPEWRCNDSGSFSSWHRGFALFKILENDSPNRKYCSVAETSSSSFSRSMSAYQ